MSISQEGYLLVAVGSHYIDEAVDLVQSLRAFKDARPVSLVTISKDVPYASSKQVFDKLLEIDESDPLYGSFQEGFEKNCLYARVCADKFLVYERTIILDTDVLCIGPTESSWELLTNFPQAVQRVGLEVDPTWHWGRISDVISRFGKNVPHSHGGFTFVNRSLPKVQEFYDFCRHANLNYDSYGCKSWFRGSKTEEVIIALAFAQLEFKHHDFFETPIMTFDLTASDNIPCYVQKAMGANVVTSTRIPFVHMCHAKKGTETYESVKRKMLESAREERQ